MLWTTRVFPVTRHSGITNISLSQEMSSPFPPEYEGNKPWLFAGEDELWRPVARRGTFAVTHIKSPVRVGNCAHRPHLNPPTPWTTSGRASFKIQRLNLGGPSDRTLSLPLHERDTRLDTGPCLRATLDGRCHLPALYAAASGLRRTS